MIDKAPAHDFLGRFREIVADPLNLLIVRHPEAGKVSGDCVTLHNGNRVWVRGPLAYYDHFSDILVINRGVHEPLEEYTFQRVLSLLGPAPAMLELGAYWAHYSMWLKRARPQATLYMVEPEASNLAAGRANLALNEMDGEFEQAFVGRGRFEVDSWMAVRALDRLDILHCDIQGYEADMLEGAVQALRQRRVNYWFVSTHSQILHRAVVEGLCAAGYRIELAADFDSQTTSFDGFVLGVHPDLPVVFDGTAPLGREDLAIATPAELVGWLAETLARETRT